MTAAGGGFFAWKLSPDPALGHNGGDVSVLRKRRLQLPSVCALRWMKPENEDDSSADFQ
jgi:hypothetical protein